MAKKEKKGGVPSDLDPEELFHYNCLHENTWVVLADGSTQRLSDIVRKRLKPNVLSYDERAGAVVARRVVGWSKSRVKDQRWVRLQIEGVSARGHAITVTPDHKVFTGQGWVEARHVRVGDRIAQPERALTADEIGALLGTLLGDSSMAFSPTRRGRRVSTAAVVGGHTDKDGLAQHKAKALRGFIRLNGVDQKGGSYPNARPLRRYATAMSPQVAGLRPLLYDYRGRKRLLPETLFLLGPAGLAWWFMDDGCLQKGRKYRFVGGKAGCKGQRGRKVGADSPETDSVTIATNCFPKKDVELAREWFNTRFGPTYVGADRVLRLSVSAAKKFCRYIASFVPPFMRYKFPRGVKWPAYRDKPLSKKTRPIYATVVAAEQCAMRRTSRTDRYRAETRYCLTVEKTHNFFTTAGLVHNSSDCRVTAKAWHEMQADLEPEREVYEHDKRLALICQEMQMIGIRMDIPHRDYLQKRMKRRAAALKGRMRMLVKNEGFDPMKLDMVRHALFVRFRAPMLNPTSSGLASTSSLTLEALRVSDNRAGKLADLILQWRGVVKVKATYLDAIQLVDGRFHPNWKPFGTVSGRLSCRLQSIPRLELCDEAQAMMRRGKKFPEVLLSLGDGIYDVQSRIREVYIPKKRHKFVYFDLSQAEMRFAAHLSGDQNFIKTCLGDVHSGNAKVLFPDKAELLDKDPKGAGKPYRDVAKNAGFGVTYLAEAETVFKFLRSKGFPVELMDVVAMLERMRAGYPDYFRFVENNVQYCRKHGNLRTAILGRIRWMGWFPKPTEVANYPIQSGIADLMNGRLIELHPKLPKSCRLVAQIHDACVFEVREGEDCRHLVELLKETWARPVKLKSNGLEFVIPIDLKEGGRWSDFETDDSYKKFIEGMREAA